MLSFNKLDCNIKKGLANIKWGLTNNDIYSFNINSCDVTNKKWV